MCQRISLPHIALSILCSTFLFQCAKQTSPMGGPKDEDPPILIRSIPQDKSKNYKERYLKFEFNEDIEIYNPSEEILIIPSIGKNIRYKIKRNTLIVEPEDMWSDSTTYSVSLREGVKDITEKNAPENIHIAFSTGPTIDSLNIKGKIKSALQESLYKGTRITVAIHRSDTFNIFEQKPSYFTKTNENGAFSLENIKQNHYYIYAFNDLNKNLKVESKTESYGFLAEPLFVDNTLDSLTIILMHVDSRKPKINSIRDNGLVTKILFNKPIIECSVQCPYDSTIIYSYGDNPSEIKIYNPRNIQDSIRCALAAKDSLDISIDTTFYIQAQQKITNFMRDEFSVVMGKATLNLDSSLLNMQITLSKPLKKINYDSIFIRLDSTHLMPFYENDFAYDNFQKKLLISKKIIMDSLFLNPETKPNWIFGKAFITSIENDSSVAQQQNITYVDEQQTGALLIEVDSDKPHYEIQLISAYGAVIKSVRDVKKYTFKNLSTREYKIRVMIDEDGNGKWNISNIYKRKEPEPVYFYKNSEGKSTFTIRANWELGPLKLVF